MRYFIYTSVYCHGCAASAEDSRQVCPACSSRIKSSHRILCFGIFIPIFCLVGKKGGNNVLSNVWSFQYSSWKKRAKYLPWPLLATKATHYFVFFSRPPCSLVFQKCEVQSLSEDQELQNWRKTETNVIAPTVSRTHARTHAHTLTSKHVRARTRPPPPEFCPTRSVPFCEVPRCHREQLSPLGLRTQTPSPRLGVGWHRMYVLGHTVVAS